MRYYIPNVELHDESSVRGAPPDHIIMEINF